MTIINKIRHWLIINAYICKIWCFSHKNHLRAAGLMFLLPILTTCLYNSSPYILIKTDLSGSGTNYSLNVSEPFIEKLHFQKEWISLFSQFQENDRHFPLFKLSPLRDKLYKYDYTGQSVIFETDIYKEYITSFSDKIITTDKNIYIRHNDGNFIKISKNGIPSKSYITSGAIINYQGGSYIFIGTTFNGLYAKSEDQNEFARIDKGMKRVPHTYPQGPFYETIQSLFSCNEILFIGYGFGKGISIIDISSSANKISGLKAKDFDQETSFEKMESITGFSLQKSSLYFYTESSIYRLNLKNKEPVTQASKENILNGKWEKLYEKELPNINNEDHIRGIYVPVAHLTSYDKIINKIAQLKSLNLNAIVVDFKDDFGYINYPSTVPEAIEMKAVKNRIPITTLIQVAHQNNIYIIARLVSFKDPKLFDYEYNKYSYIDSGNGQPWIGLVKERWVDPSSGFVREYLIKIAEELQNLGIDEVQFDYVRYPSDGGVNRIKSRYNTDGNSKNGVLFGFFQEVKSKIHIPVSADFYGYQCFYAISNHIGQDLYLLSNSLDAVYPMYYPSHFSKGFYQYQITQDQTNYYIYNHGIQRAFSIGNHRLKIRPWVQAFKWRVTGDYTSYVQSQIDGILAAGYNSFIFWNPSGKYEILKDISY